MESGLPIYKFYEKPMRSRWVTPEQSATSSQNKITWTSNDLARRLLRIEEGLQKEEATGVINGYGMKLIWSGYSLDDRKRIIESGLSDWKNRVKCLKNRGGNPYLQAHQTLEERMEKRLVEKSTWYKGWGQRTRAGTRRPQGPTPRPGTGGSKPNGTQTPRNPTGDKLEIMAPMFVDRSDGGILLERLREVEAEMAGLTGYRIKLVEKNGVKLENLLVKRDPYVGWACGRQDCTCCKAKPRRNQKDNCNKQNVLYVARCDLCQEEAICQEDSEDGEDAGPYRVGEYVGESCKSIYTRSKKHVDSYRLLDPRSFMLRHHMGDHKQTLLGGVSFTFSIKGHFTTAFRRQIAEAVAIKQSVADDKVKNLNSKLEYNRCLIPDVCALESPEEAKKEQELNEELIKMKRNGVAAWQRWKALGGGQGGVEQRRLPRLTPDELLRCTVKGLTRRI